MTDASLVFGARRLWLLKATTIVVALFLWQAGVRRPTPMAQGGSLAGLGARIVEHQTLRVASFNIAGGVSPRDHQLDLRRTASYLGSFDLIGLQEVHGAPLFWGHHQAAVLGTLLNMPWLFAPSERQWMHDSFGNAALCTLDVKHWQRIPLSMTLAASNRTLLRLDIRWHHKPLVVFITHLDRHIDHDVELGAVSAAFLDAAQPAILMGDLNTDPGDAGLAKLRGNPTVVNALAATAGAGNYDWIFARGLHRAAGGLTADDASDHPLAWAEFTDAETQ